MHTRSAHDRAPYTAKNGLLAHSGTRADGFLGRAACGRRQHGEHRAKHGVQAGEGIPIPLQKRVVQHLLTVLLVQVVLLTSGEDMRPFRLQWPASTVIYLLAEEGAHERSKAAAKEQLLRVPSGCLLRRVAARLEVGWSADAHGANG